MRLPLDRIGNARAVLLTGPTASGKSAAALELAEDIARSGRAALIVNADSMQVYDALRILTARPSPEDEARAPHRLYGQVPARQRYSVGAWLADVKPVLKQSAETGDLVIIVGGTGLYFKALTEGLADTPDIPAEVRSYWAGQLAAEGAASLHDELVRRNAAGDVRPSDTQRIVRALEVLEATGQPLYAWQRDRNTPPIIDPTQAARFVLEPERDGLYREIDRRFDTMVGDGAIEEVRVLLERNLDPDLPAMKATGVRELAAFLRGEISLAEAAARAKTETRQYAKRQLTWFRNQMRDWPRISD